MSWEDELTPDERNEWDRFVTYQREHTVKKMAESAMVISLVPGKDSVDIKFAVELGMSIMLDKPVLALAAREEDVPAKLRLVVDRLVICDIDTEEGRRLLEEAINEMMKKEHGI